MRTFKINSLSNFIFFYFLKILFIYLRERQWERAWARRRSEGEADSPWSWEPDVGLDPGTRGSWPEPKAVVQPTEPPRRPKRHFFKKRFYLFTWEIEHKQGEWEREEQAPRWAGSPMWGSIPGPGDHDLSRRQTLNRLSHPGALKLFYSIR